MIFCLRNSCVALLNRHEGQNVRSQFMIRYIIPKPSWNMRKFSFNFSDTFWLAQKISHHELLFRLNSWNFFYSSLWKILRCLMRWSYELFCFFLLFFHYWKIKKSLQWGVTQKYKLFKLLATSIALFSTSDSMKK